ncbi:hypothetical protein CYY_006587 [Polysphondylium violaceum]|uniref:Ubiquitin carboxyl-terminal hydrolase n=1 Tax=Polysphondylium violaceum TaxID=133409 RepID=A0A8J4UYV5_9MYCE|nr:hypothetical protein CYY_006587 [Polysphondylium violaceum]
MGKGKDKKKKLKNQKSLVENNKKKGGQSNKESKEKKDVVKIIVDSQGTTLTLKRIDNLYVCTDCIDQFNLSSKKSNGAVLDKPIPLECSICHMGALEGSSGVSSSTSSLSSSTTSLSSSVTDNKKKRANGNSRFYDDDVEIIGGKAIGDGVKGLDNLGNTCFFNSIMQNLTHVNLLRDLFLEAPPGSPKSVITSNSSMTNEMFNFYSKMYKSNTSRISPHGLFSEIVKKSPRFGGFKQQDSHELLRYLLDGLISEEQNATKKRKEPTYIDKVFGGKLISIITCFHCGYVSKTFEPFLDLSLPISSEKSSNKPPPNFVMPRVAKPLPLKPKSDSLDTATTTTTTTPTVKLDASGNRISKHQLKKLRAKEEKERLEKEEKEKQAAVEKDESIVNLEDDFQVVPIDGKSDENSPVSVNIQVNYSSTGSVTPNGAEEIIDTNNSPKQINIIEIDDDVDNNNNQSQQIKINVKNNNNNNNDNGCSSDIEGEEQESKEDDDNDDQVVISEREGGVELIQATTLLDEISTVTGSIIENYENPDYKPIVLLERSANDLTKSFETLHINGNDQPESDTEKEDDVQKDPIDLRKDIPSDAFNIGSLLSCLLQFTNPEKLEGENGFICSNCMKIHKEKKKQQEEEQEHLNGGSSQVIDIDMDDKEEGQEDEVVEVLVDSEPINNKKKKKKTTPIIKPKPKDEDDIEKFRRNASKQYLLSETPPFLTVQLKRFMLTRIGYQKNSKQVTFPVTLDLSSFTDQNNINNNNNNNDNSNNSNENDNSSSNDNKNDNNNENNTPPTIISKDNNIYRLNGIVEHMGGMGGGHYVAHVYDDQKDQWYYISDSNVRTTTLTQVLNSEAYLVFYKKDNFDVSSLFPSRKSKQEEVKEKEEEIKEEEKVNDQQQQDNSKDDKEQEEKQEEKEDDQEQKEEKEPLLSNNEKTVDIDVEEKIENKPIVIIEKYQQEKEKEIDTIEFKDDDDDSKIDGAELPRTEKKELPIPIEID